MNVCICSSRVSFIVNKRLFYIYIIWRYLQSAHLQILFSIITWLLSKQFVFIHMIAVVLYYIHYIIECSVVITNPIIKHPTSNNLKCHRLNVLTDYYLLFLVWQSTTHMLICLKVNIILIIIPI